MGSGIGTSPRLPMGGPEFGLPMEFQCAHSRSKFTARELFQSPIPDSISMKFSSDVFPGPLSHSFSLLRNALSLGLSI